ncbi:MAG: TIGR00296 family protein, partial [Methanomassiliicoccales archaeon]
MDNKEGEIAVQIARKVVDSVARFQKPKNIEMPES